MLTGAPPKPQIFIGIDSNLPTELNLPAEKVLGFFNKTLGDALRKFQLDCFIKSNDEEIIILNAHIHHQAVTYLDGQIKYPYLSSEINTLIKESTEILRKSPSRALSNIINSKDTEKSFKRYQEYAIALNKLQELQKIAPAYMITVINYGEEIQYRVVNKLSENILICRSHISLAEFRATIQSIIKIESLAQSLATKRAQVYPVSTNQYGTATPPKITIKDVKESKEIMYMVDDEYQNIIRNTEYNTVIEPENTLYYHFVRIYNQCFANEMQSIIDEMK